MLSEGATPLDHETENAKRIHTSGIRYDSSFRRRRLTIINPLQAGLLWTRISDLLHQVGREGGSAGYDI